MSYGMYMSAQGAMAQSRRLEVISNNMANVDTVGFKPDVALFQARFAEEIQNGSAFPGSGQTTDVGGGVKTIETLTDFRPGKLERTGNPGDVAILGEGFFAVQPDEGTQPLLTRAGVFRVDNESRLVMADTGRLVMAEGGGVVQLDPTQPFSIGSDGTVLQRSNPVARLQLVQPRSLDDLTKIGANLFASRDDVLPVEPASREVAQGFREMSGANSTQLMMEMIETNRAFEANTQLIRYQDTATGNLISRILG